MSGYRYPDRIIVSDYIRAGAGALLSLGPLTAVQPASVAGGVLGLLGALFIVFGGRTWVRSRTVVHLSDEGLAVTALRRKILPWKDVASLELRYFAARRDRSRGWMQLTLKSTDTTLRLESTLDGFDSIARAAARAAAQRNLSLSPPTLENLRALDLPTDRLRDRHRTPNEVR